MEDVKSKDLDQINFKVEPKPKCERLEYNKTCFDWYTCCSCGGRDCGCGYCFDCNACAACIEECK